VALFLITAVGGLLYGLTYHFGLEHSQEKEYLSEMEEAEIRWPSDGLATAAEMSQVDLEAGREIYQTSCAACHGEAMEGKIGPSLADSTWLYGDTFGEIQQTIAQGRPASGMPEWLPLLQSKKVSQVAYFVYSEGGGK